MTAYRTLPKTDQLPYALYRASQVRELDRIAIEQYQISAYELMARAGGALFSQIEMLIVEHAELTIIAGTGNNGGDGFVVALLAMQSSIKVNLIVVGDVDNISNDASLHLTHFLDANGCLSDTNEIPNNTGVILDSLLGTGLSRQLEGVYASWVEKINQHQADVISADIPTGLSADTGKCLGVAVKAKLTVSFIGLKQGLFTGDAANHCGHIVFESLNIPAKVYASQILSARRLDWPKVASLLPDLSRTAHKGCCGHLLVIGGDNGFAGAVLLAAKAALRTGVGRVTVITRYEHAAAIVSHCPEVMVQGYEEGDDLSSLIASANVIAIGPGLGQSGWGYSLWEQCIDLDTPLVVDADALNLLATHNRILKNAVITPHPGEASRLLDMSTNEIEADRFKSVEQLNQRFGAVAILKGAGTLIDSRFTGNNRIPIAVCSEGNPGMATAGMGDVLTGVVASLIAQGASLDEAAIMGVTLHAASADAATAIIGERGLMASDLFPHLRKLVNKHD